MIRYVPPENRVGNFDMEAFLSVLNNFKELFGHHVVFGTGILLISGYFFGKLAELVHLPSITGYIIAGVVLGQSVLAIIPAKEVYSLNSITEIALGLIAITIGAEFDLHKIRKTGTKIIIITIVQALFAFVFVVIALTAFGMDMKYCLILGAIATATAPAATVIIVRELRARGEFVDYLYGVVAFDDALCVLLFSIVFAFVGPLLAGLQSAGAGLQDGMLHVLIEIFGSCLLGIVAGISLHYFTRRRYKLNEILILAIAVLFLTTSMAIVLRLSLLISNMALGAVLINLSSKNRRIFTVIEPITPPIFALFFVLAGTELQIAVFTKGIVIFYGIVYLLSRFLGKYTGTYLSAIWTKAPLAIRKYLGFCLFPQAGVAIGLVLLVQTSPIMLTAAAPVKAFLVVIVNVVLFSIFVNELIGPIITRYGVIRGAEL